MKTHTIKTPTAELLIVEMPEGGKHAFYDDVLHIFDYENDSIYPLKGSYTLLGKPDEIREEDAKELVEERTDIEGNCYYEDHGIVNGTTPTATESLLSALETVVQWDNPLLKPRWDEVAPLESWNDYQDAVDEWKQAELRTFDRSRTLIFVKN